MSNQVGWRFPPTNGGRIDGYNDPGIAHFGGAPLSSLARETLQNSLDARLRSEEPVHVSFELALLAPRDIGSEELKRAVAACRDGTEEDKVVGPALALAAKHLERKELTCLRVSDRNTIGLRGEHWRALVKMQGVSHKPNVVGAGGSYGIGKYAPFAVSALRTVFYWTSYRENGKLFEKCQGKAVLMSHLGAEGETQGTGFYGDKDECSELTERLIPECFRLTTQSGEPVRGTSVVIVGFRASTDWRQRIASSVIGNFFYAIGAGWLSVMVEPEESGDAGMFEINQESLSQWFDDLEESYATAGQHREERTAICFARRLWHMQGDEADYEKQDNDFGHCRLWVRVGDGLPSRVGIVRRTGMLITTRQRRLLRFPGFQEFAALCVFEDPDGNELLRRMENPTHDQFEPDRLPEVDRDRGRRALNRITKWIRDSIRKKAGPPPGGKRTVLAELATYLPDLQPEEPFEDKASDVDGSGEPGFGNRVTVALKPVKRRKPPALPYDEDGTADGDGDGPDGGQSGGGGTEPNGGSGGSGGQGEGKGRGGTGTRGGGGNPKAIPVSRVRLLPIDQEKNRYRLSFDADGEGVVRLVLEEAGDSSAVSRGDIRSATEGLSLDSIRVERGNRTVLEVTADAPIGDRAWRLSAIPAKGVRR